ncbi:MAG: hypothetical protein A2086_05670 [Spirochaetes bacterium GWD1_27_9]|nr:MAG: hypothetical protein A2Y34_08695 [Spirochaetes bacterium GWC1_27_15]OHD37628.1 MAG: hypothetical protein A2086_05670 [Spirochaetes bacterium GWD1_27_9]
MWKKISSFLFVLLQQMIEIISNFLKKTKHLDYLSQNIYIFKYNFIVKNLMEKELITFYRSIKKILQNKE